MTTPISTATRQRLVDRLVARRGMHPTTARNVVEHVVEHGRNSPWAREVNAAGLSLTFELYSEFARQALLRAAHVYQRLGEALRAGAAQDNYVLTGHTRTGTQAQQSPYGPAPRKARR